MSSRMAYWDIRRSMIPIRVLGDRVLVKPDVNDNAPVTTEAGIVLAPSLASAVTGSDPTLSVSRGTVIGVGVPKHPFRDEAEVMAAKLAMIRCDDDLCIDAAALLTDLVRRQACVSIGDDVLFSHDAGQLIELEQETFVILQESELLGVVNG